MHFTDPFGQAERAGAEHLPVVELLEGLAVALIAGDLADEQDQRRRVLERRVQSDAGVGRPRPAGDKTDAGAAAELALRFSHESRAAFLATSDETDFFGMLVEAVEHGQIAFARHAKNRLDTLCDQRFDQQMAGNPAWI